MLKVEKAGHGRSADPYRDFDVIDERAPRFNQAVVGVFALVALLTGWWWPVALMALQLILGLTFGRKFCLACVFYFEFVQPRIGEGEIEDARPPRFANIIGAVVLSASTLAFIAGWNGVGRALAGVVAVLALLAAFTGLCVGCEIYRISARLRGVRPGKARSLDLAELGAPATDGEGVVVHFTHPLCTGCRTVEERLRSQGRTLVTVDVSERPDVARRYHVSVVPLTLAVDPSGRVLERLA